MFIKVVLKQEMKRHFDELEELKCKMEVGKQNNEFPSSSEEDRILVMGSLIKISDMSWTMRPPNIFFKWQDAMCDDLGSWGL